MSGNLSPQYAVLGLLCIEPIHGYELHRRLETGLREVWHISQSQTYNVLKRLESEGLVISSTQPQEKRPDRSLLYPTLEGKNVFDIWLNTPTRGEARALRVEFLTRLFFARQIDSGLCSRLLREQAVFTRTELDQLNARLAQAPSQEIFNRLGLELRIRQVSSMLDWLDTCETKLLY